MNLKQFTGLHPVFNSRAILSDIVFEDGIGFRDAIEKDTRIPHKILFRRTSIFSSSIVTIVMSYEDMSEWQLCHIAKANIGDYFWDFHKAAFSELQSIHNGFKFDIVLKPDPRTKIENIIAYKKMKYKDKMTLINNILEGVKNASR